MPVETRGTLGKLEFGGYPFGNVSFLSFDVNASIGDTLSIALYAENNTTPSNFLAIDWGDDSASSTQSAVQHEYRSSGVFTVNIAAQPDFEGVTESKIDTNPGTNNANLTLDFANYLSKLEDVEEVNLAGEDVDLTTSPSQSELQGVKKILLNGNAKRGTGRVFVERLDSTIEVLRNRLRGGSAFLAGDWAAAGGLNSLTKLFSRATMDVSGTLSDLQNAAPNVERLRYPDGGSLHDDGSITEFHGMSNLGRLTTKAVTGKVQGQFADFDHPSLGPGQGTQALTYHKHIKQPIEGDFGNLPSWTEVWSSERAKNITFSGFDPSNYSNFYSIRFEPLTYSSNAKEKANVLPASLANGASSINSYPDGGYIGLSTRSSGQPLDGWTPYQQAFRALGVKPDVSWSLSGGIDTSPWNSHWAVAGNVSYPSSAEITVDKPASDGESDTATDDGSAIPTGSTLPNANGGSGALLHIFEDSPNQSGPSDQNDSATEYIISSVTDNGDGTITFGLDTGSGPAISDTASGDLDANTRIAFTW